MRCWRASIVLPRRVRACKPVKSVSLFISYYVFVLPMQSRTTAFQSGRGFSPLISCVRAWSARYNQICLRLCVAVLMRSRKKRHCMEETGLLSFSFLFLSLPPYISASRNPLPEWRRAVEGIKQWFGGGGVVNRACPQRKGEFFSAALPPFALRGAMVWKVGWARFLPLTQTSSDRSQRWLRVCERDRTAGSVCNWPW